MKHIKLRVRILVDILSILEDTGGCFILQPDSWSNPFNISYISAKNAHIVGLLVILTFIKPTRVV